MQTFLPYKDFKKCAKYLDYRRLGKQRVEAFQILNILLNRTDRKGYQNHPIVKMWRGYENALKEYYNIILQEWIDRGYNNTMKFETIQGNIIYPNWLGSFDFHASHRSNLLRKDKLYYSQFNWTEKDDLKYLWYVDNKWITI